MNKILKLMLLVAAPVALFSCKDDENPPTPTPDPTPTDTAVVLSGELTTKTLDKTKTYLIRGIVTIPDGVTLTIPAGTILKGEKKTKGTLLVRPGGKLVAEGTASEPIVFTSNQGIDERDKGDWGGLVILGRANCNQNNPAIEGISPAANFGTFQSTANDTENSGTLKYVRVEYAGIALSPNNETNSITFGGVGSGTVVEYVQVSYGGDDGFEWFGGTVNCKNIISYGTWDDDFDCDFGWSGNVQYALAIRDPFSADQSGSNAFECDNEGAGNAVEPYTSGVFSNVTVLGPVVDSTKSASSNNSGNYQHAMHLRRRTAISVFNSVIAGFPIGFRLDGLSTEEQYTTNNRGVVANNIMVNIGQRAAAKPYESGSGNTKTSVEAYWLANNNSMFTKHEPAASMNSKNYARAYADAGIDPSVIMGFSFTNATYPSNPNFGTAFTGASQTGASFTNPKVSGSFFNSTTFKGAFGTTDWTDGWAEFQPQKKEY